MKQIFSVLLTTILSLFICQQTEAQVTVSGNTNTTPNLSSSYTSLAGAITALNGVTAISGSVVFTLASGYKEIAPSGGYAISFPATTTSSDTIIFDGGPTYDTIVANSGLPAGALNDAIFKIIGCDFVTIKRFTMMENSANTTINAGTNNMTEWGVALLRSSATNGAQNNTIIDNIISLNRTYPNSFGIYSNVRHSSTVVGTASDITSITGSNHDNKVHYNRIKNVSMGIVFIGSSTDARMDDANDVGGTSSSTGNILTEWGGNSMVTATFTGNIASEYYGILMRCEKNCNVSWNSIVSSTSMSGAVAAPIRGIHIGSTTGTLTGTFTTTVDYNTVTITDNLPTGSSSLSRVDGIFCGDKLGSGTLSISNNLITGIAVTASGSGRQIRGISNTASVDALYINYNIIKGNTSTATASIGGWFFAIDQLGTITSTAEVNYNLIGDYSSTTPAITYTSTASGGAFVRGINYSPASNPTGTSSISISGNSMYGFVQTSTSANHHTYILCDHTTTLNSIIQVDGNHFDNITANTTGDVTFINSPGTMATGAGAQLLITNNDIVGSFTKGAGGDVYIYNASGSSSTGNTMVESGNNFSNITLSGSAVMHGWYNIEGASAAGPEKFIKDNIFQNWICSTSGTGAANVIYCDWASGNSEISGNVLSGISSNASLNGITDASSTPTTITYNGNQLSDLSSNSVLNGINIIGGGNVARTLSNNAVTLFSTTATSVFAVQWSAPPVTGTGSELYCYYNTIYVSVIPGVSISFSSTACLAVRGFAVSGTNRSFVRNNIFINNSVPVGTGAKAAVIYNQGVIGAIANYSATSNNNSFWLGTPLTATSPTTSPLSNSTHVIYQDGPSNLGGTDAVSLSDFQGIVPTPAETKSFKLMPVFIQDNPSLGMVDLHLLSDCGNNALFNHGDNSGIGATKDWSVDGDPRFNTGPNITDIGADEHILTNTWTGNANSPLWTNNSNWAFAFPNNSEVNIYIPKALGSRPQPLIAGGASWQVRDVYFQTGLPSTSRPLLTNQGTLKIAGEIIGDGGSFNNYGGSLVKGSIELNSDCRVPAQPLGGLVFVDKKVYDLRIRNNVNIRTDANNGVKVVGELNFGSLTGLTLNTGPSTTTHNENLTLVSTNDRTANIASIALTNIITGDVTVERYINTGQGPAAASVPAQHRKAWEFLATPTGSAVTGVGQTVYESWQENGVVPTADNGYGTWVVGTGTGFDFTTAASSVQAWDPIGGPTSDGVWVDITNTNQQVYDKRGYQVLVRGDRFAQFFTSPPTPTVMRTKGPLYQPSNVPPQTTVLPTLVGPPSLTIYTSVGNPYASAINISNLISTGFSGVSTDIVVWDPLLTGLYNLGGYQYLTAATGYQPSPGGTDFYPTGIAVTDLQSSQAFFVRTPTSQITNGTVTFAEGQKSTANKLVNRPSTEIKRKVFSSSLYTENGFIADGNTVVFDDRYTNKFDDMDVLKLSNPGENFVLTRDNKRLAVETRVNIIDTDTLFYDFSNLHNRKYQLRFASQNLSQSGIEAYLIDKYMGTSCKISLVDSSFINFLVNDDKASCKNRFILIFKKIGEEFVKENQSTLIVYPNPVQDQIVKFRLGEAKGDYNVTLNNLAGQSFYSGKIQISDKTAVNSIKLNSTIARGSYQLTLTSSTGQKWVQQILIN